MQYKVFKIVFPFCHATDTFARAEEHDDDEEEEGEEEEKEEE